MLKVTEILSYEGWMYVILDEFTFVWYIQALLKCKITMYKGLYPTKYEQKIN